MKEVWIVLLNGKLEAVCASAYRARVTVADLLGIIQDRRVPWDLVSHGAEWSSNGSKIEIVRKDVDE